MIEKEKKIKRKKKKRDNIKKKELKRKNNKKKVKNTGKSRKKRERKYFFCPRPRRKERIFISLPHEYGKLDLSGR